MAAGRMQKIQGSDIHWHVVNKLLEKGLRRGVLYSCSTGDACRAQAEYTSCSYYICPSKIFHYHNIGDIEGTVIAKTLQDWLSMLSAARVRKSSAYDCI